MLNYGQDDAPTPEARQAAFCSRQSANQALPLPLQSKAGLRRWRRLDGLAGIGAGDRNSFVTVARRRPWERWSLTVGAGGVWEVELIGVRRLRPGDAGVAGVGPGRRCLELELGVQLGLGERGLGFDEALAAGVKGRRPPRLRRAIGKSGEGIEGEGRIERRRGTWVRSPGVLGADWVRS